MRRGVSFIMVAYPGPEKIKQRNRNRCDAESLLTKPVTNITCKQQVLTNIWQQKSQKTKGLHHNFPVTHKSYSPSIEFIIIGQLQLLHRGILAKNRIQTLSKGPRGHDDELNRKLIQPDKSPPNTHPDH